MNDEHIGIFLRRQREQAGISLDDVALRTKIRSDFLQRLETGRFAELPAEVFVRGFARAYASAVRADAHETTRLLDLHYSAPTGPAHPRETQRTALATGSVPADRRRVALVVLVILIAATLTLSLFVRRPSPTAGGLSQAEASSPVLS